VAGIADPDAEQHPDKDDRRQSLRAHAGPRLAAALACVILLCNKTVITAIRPGSLSTPIVQNAAVSNTISRSLISGG
jgi:hypothetical protein